VIVEDIIEGLLLETASTAARCVRRMFSRRSVDPQAGTLSGARSGLPDTADQPLDAVEQLSAASSAQRPVLSSGPASLEAAPSDGPAMLGL
jgi:hypothetical protein